MREPESETKVLVKPTVSQHQRNISKKKEHIPVVPRSPAIVNHGMDVSSPTGVKAWVDGLELDNTLIVGIEPSAEEGIHMDSIGRASHAAVTSVVTSGVGTPDLYEGVGEGLAGGAVDDTNIEDERHTAAKIAYG